MAMGRRQVSSFYLGGRALLGSASGELLPVGVAPLFLSKKLRLWRRTGARPVRGIY